MHTRKIAVALAVGAAVLLFFIFDLGRYLSLDYLKQSHEAFAGLYAQQPLLVAAAYFAIYVAVTALSFPGAAILTLAGGAIFGLGVGTLIVSFSSSLGALLAFLAARFVLRDSIRARFKQRVADIDRGIERDSHVSVHAPAGAADPFLRH